MKTALIVTGIPRLDKKWTEKLLEKYYQVFPNADVWNGVIIRRQK